MTVIYQDLLARSYLLVLAPDLPGALGAPSSLAEHLRRACGSGKPTVWVDCRLLDTLSVATARLLWACHLRLRRRRVRLVLCRVSEHVEQTLRLAGARLSPDLWLASTLDDEARQLTA